MYFSREHILSTSFKTPSLLWRLFVPLLLQSSGNLEAPTRIRRQGDSAAKVQGDAKKLRNE